MNGKARALVLDPRDNVATLLENAASGALIVLSGRDCSLTAAEPVPYGHKISLVPIADGNDIVKYGQRIGIAVRDIATGCHVHLDAMRSAVDPTFRKRIDGRS